LSEPVQVVWRKAVLEVEEVELDEEGGDGVRQLYERVNPRRQRMDLRRAPMLRVYIARDPGQERWLMLELLHHLTGDHSTLEIMEEETQAYLLGQEETLAAPLPFRNVVAQARLGVSREEHEEYFRRVLGDVEEVTAPFGMVDVLGDGTGIKEARVKVKADVAKRLREQARKLGVSAASICHLAWGRVLGQVTGRRGIRDGIVWADAIGRRIGPGDGAVYQYAAGADCGRGGGSGVEREADARAAGGVAQARTRAAGGSAAVQPSDGAGAAVYGAAELPA
jgi:hypothetical protein